MASSASNLQFASLVSMMLSMMISSPRQPGNGIDVYLNPLIEDLTKLSDEGVLVFNGF